MAIKKQFGNDASPPLGPALIDSREELRLVAPYDFFSSHLFLMLLKVTDFCVAESFLSLICFLRAVVPHVMCIMFRAILIGFHGM